MPTYEYKCPACGATDEVNLKMDIVDLKAIFCTTDGTEMKRLFSVPGVVFKGTGFYSTDKHPPKAEPKPESKKETKSETSNSSGDIGSKGSNGASYASGLSGVRIRGARVQYSTRYASRIDHSAVCVLWSFDGADN